VVRAKSAALKPSGLTLAQYVALVELDAQPGITGAALARASLVTPQAMMVVLKALEEHALIVRSPHPRHPTVLELGITDPGREALAAARRPSNQSSGRCWASSRRLSSRSWATCSLGGHMPSRRPGPARHEPDADSVTRTRRARARRAAFPSVPRG
jgi:DNA-binding MarR family transcriptional regulator